MPSRYRANRGNRTYLNSAENRPARQTSRGAVADRSRAACLAVRSLVERLEGRMMLSAAAGHDVGSALNVGTLSASTAQYQGTIGFDTNLDDFYKFTVSKPSQVSVGLSGLMGNAALELQTALGTQLSFSSFSILSGSAPGSAMDVKYLDPGTYYADVQGYSTPLTNYAINFSAAPASQAGHTISAATNIGGIGGTSRTLTDTLSPTTSDDFWEFSTTSGLFSAAVSGMKPSEGLIEVISSSGQVMAPLIDPNNPPDPNVLGYPPTPLSAGTYYLHLESMAPASTPFSVAVTAGASQTSKMGGTDQTSARNLGTLGGTQTYNSYVKLTQPADWYKFTVSSPQTVTATLSNMAANVTVGIEDASSTTLAQSTYIGNVPQTLSVALNPGTYYADVTMGGSAYSNFSISLATGPASIPADSAGNSPSAARNIGALGTGIQSYNDWVGAADTNDYYSFTVGANSTIDLSVTGNVNLALYDSSGSNVVTSANTNGKSASISTQAVSAGTYYARVYPAGSDSYYSIALSDVPAVVITTPADYAGNTPSAARNIGTLGTSTQTYNDWVGAADTNDYYSFTVAAGSTINAAVTGNADVALYDSSGTNLLTSGNSNGQSSSLSEQVANAGTYYLRVYPAGADTYYSVALSASAAAAPAPPPPIVITTPPDLAGNSPAAARNVGTVGDTPQTFTDWIGAADTNDYYSFTVSVPSTAHLNLTGLTGTAYLGLYDGTASGQTTSPPKVMPLVAVSSNNQPSVSITQKVNPGTYFARVFYAKLDQYYNLAISAVPITTPTNPPPTNPPPTTPADYAGNTPSAARNIGTLGTSTQTYNDWVGAADTNDYYSFTVAAGSTINAAVTGNADVALYGSSGTNLLTSGNSNGQSSSLSEQVANAGVYYLRVYPAGADTNYSVALSAAAPVVTAPGSDGDSTLATARAIPNPIPGGNFQYTDAYVGPNDTTDYFRFNVTSVTKMVLWATRFNSTGVQISLLDQNGNVMDTVNSSQGNPPVLLDGLQPGVYYMKVTALTSGPGTTYRAWFLAQSYADGAGNTPQAAHVISTPLDAAGAQFLDFVGKIDPSDYYQFNLQSTSDVTFSMLGAANMTLLDSTGQKTLASAVSTWQQPGTLHAAALPAGKYYALVSYSTMDSNYRLTMSAHGSGVVTPPVTPPPVTPPTTTPGTTIGSAVDIGAVTGALRTFTGTVTAASPANYYKLTLAQPQNLNVVVDRLNATATTHFVVLDASGQGVMTGMRTSAVSLWEAQNLAAGTYYIEITTTSGDSNYRLALV